MSGFSRTSRLNPEDYYYSDEGYLVFTSTYLAKRGYCCESGCRHCPYGYSNRSKKDSEPGTKPGKR